MTEIVPYRQQGDYDASWLLDPAEIAQRIGGTDFVPEALRSNPAAITAALLYGDEVGLGRMQSLAKIAVINGRPTLAAEAQRGLIRAAGHRIWFEESTTTRCIACGKRADEDEISRVTWTMDDAQRANLAGKPPWRMYPRQMLKARASAELARDLFPDVIGGLAATEEADDEQAPANGAEPAAARSSGTRRRRRAAIAAPEPPSEPATPDKPEPDPEPPADEDDAQGASQERTAEQIAGDEAHSPGADSALPPPGQLPAAEQALVDEAIAAGAHEVQPDMVTDPQRRKMHALFRDVGIADRADRLRYCAGVVERQLTTSSELTKDEAGKVIDHLEKYDRDDPQTWPFPEGF
ncbi:MAG TPA: recombinase RecT [Solirubrobacteraceae bacterium]|jgi:hypothetical protein